MRWLRCLFQVPYVCFSFCCCHLLAVCTGPPSSAAAEAEESDIDTDTDLDLSDEEDVSDLDRLDFFYIYTCTLNCVWVDALEVKVSTGSTGSSGVPSEPADSRHILRNCLFGTMHGRKYQIFQGGRLCL